MGERETPQAIYDRAAEWVARVDRSDADHQTLAELKIWLAGDERRRGAYFRAEAAWAMLDRVSVLGAGRQEDVAEEAQTRSRPSRRQILWGGGAIAASMGAIVASLGLWRTSHEKIETAVGEIRRVPLHDGSLAAVNTDTKLTIDLKPEVRKVALETGEAWFQVAKDRARPFIVEAGDVRVKAIGTAFAVRRAEAGASVQVTEGVVEVWSVGDELNVRRISAGARTFVNDVTGPAAAVTAASDIDRELSWRNGQLIFDGDTLAKAAAEFNRYNRTQVIVIDPTLSEEKLVGRFRTNEPDAFARAAAAMLGARAQFAEGRITISRH